MPTTRQSARLAAQEPTDFSNVIPTESPQPVAAKPGAASPLLDVPNQIPVPSPTRVAYEDAIRKAYRIVWTALPEGDTVVTGSAALWLADKDAEWFPDDIDIPVWESRFFDLVGRLTMLRHKRVKDSASGYCFEVPLWLPEDPGAKITVQVYPVKAVMDSIAQHDLEAVRCWAVPAGRFSMKVCWCPGVDVDKVLREHRTDYYHVGKGCKRESAFCKELGQSRAEKYRSRGFTVESKEGISACPYCAQVLGYENTWQLASQPRTRNLRVYPQCPVDGLSVIQAGYEPPYFHAVALRWLEQHWVATGRKLTKGQLLACLPRPPPPCPVNGDVLRAHGFPPYACGSEVKAAQRRWHETGFTATKDELLDALDARKFRMQAEDARRTRKQQAAAAWGNAGTKWAEREEAKVDLRTHVAKAETNARLSSAANAASGTIKENDANDTTDDDMPELVSASEDGDEQEREGVMVSVGEAGVSVADGSGDSSDGDGSDGNGGFRDGVVPVSDPGTCLIA
jgi:hypothetical protein